MFLVVNLLARGILLAVDLLPLLVGELAAVCRRDRCGPADRLRTVSVGAGRFTGGHLAAAQAVGNALVLIGFAIVGVVVAAGGAVSGRDGLRLRVLLRDLMIRLI